MVAPLGRRARVAGALVTVAAAAALALAVGGRGCDSGDTTPEGVVRAYVTAARDLDKRTMWDLAGPQMRAAMTRAAEAATDKVGGAQRLEPLEVFEVSTPPTTYAPVKYVLKERNGDSAVVDVLGPDGQHDSVQVVRIAGRWKVEIPF